MAPKKKGGKHQDDDWEADLGEAPPTATEPQDADGNANGNADEDSGMGGGLLAALKKNKNKRAKKGRAGDDFLDGEDPTAEGDGITLNGKAPEEANLAEDDVFAGTSKKGKPGKQDEQKQSGKAAAADKEDEGGLKSKKEKEKEKKEREKQRKKEQVCLIFAVKASLTALGC